MSDYCLVGHNFLISPKFLINLDLLVKLSNQTNLYSFALVKYFYTSPKRYLYL